MDHAEIRARNFADLYLADDLSAEEKASFEEHFFDCEECLRDLELARSFRQGLRESANLRPAPQRWRMLLAFAAGAVLTLASVALLRRTADRPAPQPAVNEQAKITELQRELAQAAAPQASVDIYPLNVAREAGAVTQVRLPSTRRTLVLMLDRQPDPAFASYRARLSDATGRAIWSQDGIQPGAHATFAISLPSDLLHPGDYFLDFEGDRGSGAFHRMARYQLRAVPSAGK